MARSSLPLLGLMLGDCTGIGPEQCARILSDGRVADARVAVGACSAVAQRLTRLERELKGQPVTAGVGSLVTADHLKDLSPIDDVRATAAYRRESALLLVQRAVDACARNS